MVVLHVLLSTLCSRDTSVSAQSFTDNVIRPGLDLDLRLQFRETLYLAGASLVGDCVGNGTHLCLACHSRGVLYGE